MADSSINKALRMRRMPSAVSPPRNLLLMQRCDRSKADQYRPTSTLRETSSAQANKFLSALLHGQQDPKNMIGQHESSSMGQSERSTPVNQNSPPSTQQVRKGFTAMQGAKDSGRQKRKAHEPLSPPSTSRRKTNEHAAKAIRALKAADLGVNLDPDLPRQLVEFPKQALHNILDGYAKLKSVISGPKRSLFLCRLVCSSPEGKEIAVAGGQGKSRKDAENAAYRYLAAECKHNELLKPRLALLQIDKIDGKVLKEEKNAKLDIYNYAARFDAIPEIIEKPMLRSRGAQKRRIHEITVRLPEQNIEATGRGMNHHSAEIAAALRFKEAAEKFQAEYGNQSLVIKDSAALTTDNSRKFFDFYKIKHPNAAIEIDRTSANGQSMEELASGRRHPAQISLNGELIGQAVFMSYKQGAEDLAFLTAAIEIKKKEPSLFPEFVRALAAGNGDILRPMRPLGLVIDEDCQFLMRETLLSARKAGLPDEVEGLISDEQKASRPRPFRRRLSPSELEHRNQHLKRELNAFLVDPKYAELRQKKEELPMSQHRAQVLDLISNSPYSIIIGATGSGKTTQVPQIILEDAIAKGSGATCNVICTQPRRIAATSVARRVAVEKGENIQGTVGYHVRFDAKLPRYGGSITYCTTGILLQQLQHQPDEVMDGISHLVIDEVHERDILVDFLLILLKKALTERVAAGKSTPKVVLMSATINTELFASYFQTRVEGRGLVGCPSLSVPGRTFPVKEKYLEEITNELVQAHSGEASRLLQQDPATADYLKAESDFSKQNPSTQKNGTTDTTRAEEFSIDWKSERKMTAEGDSAISTEKDDAVVPLGLVATTIAHISKTTDEGAILVFLPGLDEMSKVEELLYSHPLGLNFRDASKYKVHLLHSSIPTAQTDVFNEVPPGCRKIILSTNIAETSVTIPDVQYVVDSGKLREKQYDQVRRITQLKCTWISKSSSKQRAGRAGRVQNGNYYALFSAERYNALRAVGLPEMLRTDLQDICLDIKAQAFDYPIRNFLAHALEPPAPKTVDASVMNLQALDALTAEEQITPLGRLLASLPVHPSLGKMIVLGVIFRCLDPMLVIGAAAGERNLFLSPLENKRAAKGAKSSFAQDSASDHIGLLNAVRMLRQLRDTKGEYALRQYSYDNFIHVNAFKNIDNTAKQIEEILVDAGLVPSTPELMRHGSQYGDPSLNANSSKVPFIKALTIAGLHPNLAIATGGLTHRTPGEAKCLIHPSSVNSAISVRSQKGGNEDAQQLPGYGTPYSYSAMARSNDGNSVYLRDTTQCTPFMVALFGGKLSRPGNENILEMDNWLPFYVKSNARHTSYTQVARMVWAFREALDRLLARAFMDLKGSPGGAAAEGFRERGTYLADDRLRGAFAEALVEILDRDADTAMEEKKEQNRQKRESRVGGDVRRVGTYVKALGGRG
ncbi:MAG: hypothetical protein Q9225_002442 [Loekoesia sp. 1 TL-2023]